MFAIEIALHSQDGSFAMVGCKLGKNVNVEPRHATLSNRGPQTGIFPLQFFFFFFFF